MRLRDQPYCVTVIDYEDCLYEHYARMTAQSADILRDALQQRYPVVGVVPITEKQYRVGVSEI